MISTVTLTLNDPDVLAAVGYGDSAGLIYVAERLYTVRSIEAKFEWVLANLYFRRTEPASHILWQSWKDWGFNRAPRIELGWTLELEVVWMGDTAPSSPRVAVVELEET